LSKAPDGATPGGATPGGAAPGGVSQGGAALRQWTHTLQIPTRGKALYEFTSQIAAWLAQQAVSTGLLTVFVQHTSASLLIQENADPDVMHDLNVFFGRIAPEDNRLYRHTIEGPDDMPAHIRAALTATQLSIPVARGRMTLGTWQGVYLFEHRAAAHRRSVVLHLLGDAS
jgi:secondary thiamine-phosphate synthase enzyme